MRISKTYESFEPGCNSIEEVTIGGKKWNSGDYDQYKDQVKERVEILIDYLNRQILQSGC